MLDLHRSGLSYYYDQWDNIKLLLSKQVKQNALGCHMGRSRVTKHNSVLLQTLPINVLPYCECR